MATIEKAKYIVETILLWLSPALLLTSVALSGYCIVERIKGRVVIPKTIALTVSFVFIFVFSVGFWLSDEYSRTKLDAKTIERLAALNVEEIDLSKLTDDGIYSDQGDLEIERYEYSWNEGRKPATADNQNSVDMWIRLGYTGEPFNPPLGWYERLFYREIKKDNCLIQVDPREACRIPFIDVFPSFTSGICIIKDDYYFEIAIHSKKNNCDALNKALDCLYSESSS